MGAIDTNYTFTATDVITSTKMNNILDQSTITATAIIGETLAVTTGKLSVKAGGITSNELAANAVTTTAILDANVTPAKLSNSDFGDFTVASGIATLDNNVVTAAKLNGAQTGAAPIFGVRAWVRFNGNKNSSGDTDASNTARQILGSGNVTSVTKISSGRYTVDFEVDLPSGNYTMTGHRAYEAGDGQGVTVQSDPSNTQTAGSFTFYTLGAGTADAANSNDVQVMFIG
jgi:hypothetical protein